MSTLIIVILFEVWSSKIVDVTRGFPSYEYPCFDYISMLPSCLFDNICIMCVRIPIKTIPNGEFMSF